MVPSAPGDAVLERVDRVQLAVGDMTDLHARLAEEGAEFSGGSASTTTSR